MITRWLISRIITYSFSVNGLLLVDAATASMEVIFRVNVRSAVTFWLWRWLLHRLSKCQSQPITVNFVTTPTWTTNQLSTYTQLGSGLSLYFKYLNRTLISVDKWSSGILPLTDVLTIVHTQKSDVCEWKTTRTCNRRNTVVINTD